MSKKRCIIYLSMILLMGILYPMSGVAQDIEIVDGVRIVHNDKPKNSNISIELERVIGSMDTNDDNYMLYMPSALEKDDEGNIYVLDAGNFRVQKYDSNGKYLLTFGREGRGPGEFSMPQSVEMGNDGKLYLFDQGSSLMHVFHKDGKFDESYRPEEAMGSFIPLKSGNYVISAMGGMMMGGMGRGRGGAQSAMSEMQRMKAEAMPLLKIVDRKGSLIREFGEAVEYGDGFTNRFGNGFNMTSDQNDNIYITFTNQNRIEKFDSNGKLLMKIDRRLGYDVTEAQADVRIDDQGAGNIRMMIRSPEMNNVSEAIAVDGKGRIWVVTNKRQLKDDEEAGMNINLTINNGVRSMTMQPSGNTDVVETDAFELEVFDGDGILLAKIPLTHFVDTMRIFGDTLYIIDQIRGMQVFEYTINN
ncbi:hypothetical protein IIB79_06710 [candidate division KSB1 bacterium]|nr:hypothetical protein [candidate division KSB1 bacterium]